MKRTIEQIMGRASKLGIYTRRWLEDDIDLIAKWYPKIGFKNN